MIHQIINILKSKLTKARKMFSSESLTCGSWLQIMSLSYLPGTASLLEELDKKLMVLLRDGRTLIGGGFLDFKISF